MDKNANHMSLGILLVVTIVPFSGTSIYPTYWILAPYIPYPGVVEHFLTDQSLFISRLKVQ